MAQSFPSIIVFHNFCCFYLLFIGCIRCCLLEIGKIPWVCNLTDLEIDLLQRLMSSLSSVLFSPSLADSRTWFLSSLGFFLVKSFFLAMSKVSNPILFLSAKFLWSSKAPSKVKALAWLVAHGTVNTNDKLQLRRPYKSLCPQWCIFCKGNGELIDHLFLHCPVTIGLWHKLFNLAGLA